MNKTLKSDLSYKPSIGKDGLFDLWLPEKLPCPLFIYMHGGGIESGDKTSIGDLGSSLSERGIALASINYRMYPTAKYPEFIEDCADAVAYIMENAASLSGGAGFDSYYVGGSSAGGYLSMMLYFDPRYLGRHGIDPDSLAGYIFNAGQPTTHFNVLRERGIDSRAIRVDEAAPLYYIDHAVENPFNKARLLFIAADNDMACRLEQHRVMLRTMFQFGYSQARVEFKLMNGFWHCGYDSLPVYADIISEFIG